MQIFEGISDLLLTIVGRSAGQGILRANAYMLTSWMTSPTRSTGVASWPVQDAKARFSELLDTCLKEGPQIVTRRGVEAVVVVPAAEWRRLQQTARPTLKALLLAPSPRGDLDMPERGRLRRRRPDAAG